MSLNLAYLRLVLSGPNVTLPATLICFGFFSLMMSIKLLMPTSEGEDGLYKFMDEVNEGILIEGDMRPDHLKGNYSKIDTNYKKDNQHE
jgi:hypothetical protein